MHVALDLRMVGRPLHGIARYALELARRLPAMAPRATFELLVGPQFEPSFLPGAPGNVRLVRARTAFLSPAEQLELPLLLARLRPQLYHSPSFSTPAAFRGNLALTIHDANHLAFPDAYGALHGLYYRHLVRPGALRARTVYTVSEFARDELRQRLGIPKERIQVVYNGVDPVFRPQPEEAVARFRAERGLPERFALYVGNAKPHKNLPQLLEAFSHVPGDLGLVLCTSRSGVGPLLAKAGANASRVRVIEMVGDEELPLLYASARLFAFPSLYEGFGLPPLEAMACGTPVVAVHATAVPEVLGEAALFVEPRNAEALAEAMIQIDENQALADRLRQAGLARAAQFNWDATAQQVLAGYRAALGEA